MENYLVKDLMVPLSEYATVHVGSTLFEAVQALEKAQEEFDHTRYKHRGILIMDKNNRVIGKLSQLHTLLALEPKLDEIHRLSKSSANSAFSAKYRPEASQTAAPTGAPLKDLCKKAAS